LLAMNTKYKIMIKAINEKQEAMTGSLPVTTYNCTVGKLWRNLVMKIQIKEGSIARVKDEIIMIAS